MKRKQITDLYSIISKLKFTKRQGWLDKKLDADTMSAHIYGAMVLGWSIAAEEKVNPTKVVEILLVHDLVMAVMEDVTPASGKYEEKESLENNSKGIIAITLPEPLRDKYLSYVDEYQKQETKESIVAREADKLETLLQGETYEKQTGNNHILDGFLQGYKSVFKTKTGRKLFEDIESRHQERKSSGK